MYYILNKMYHILDPMYHILNQCIIFWINVSYFQSTYHILNQRITFWIKRIIFWINVWYFESMYMFKTHLYHMLNQMYHLPHKDCCAPTQGLLKQIHWFKIWYNCVLNKYIDSKYDTLIQNMIHLVQNMIHLIQNMIRWFKIWYIDSKYDTLIQQMIHLIQNMIRLIQNMIHNF